MNFCLKVVDGEPRAVFPEEEAKQAELLSRLLAPSPYYITILLWEIIRVEKGRAEGWTFDDSNLRITCTPESLGIEESALDATRRDSLSRVEFSLGEAKSLLSRWRFEHVRWEFQQRQRKAGEGLHMDTDGSRDEKAVERPILFRVADRTGRHLGQVRDLVGAVSIADRNRRRSERHSSFLITAVYTDGTEDMLLPEQYSRSKEITGEDALRYIRRRDEGILMAKEIGLSDLQVEILLAEQLERCRPSDPEEKQVEDYINSAPEEWLKEEDLRSEEANIYRTKDASMKKRKAGFIFSM